MWWRYKWVISLYVITLLLIPWSYATPQVVGDPVKVANGYTTKLTCNIGKVTESVKWVYNDVIYYSCSAPLNGGVNCVVGSSVHNPDLYDFQFLPESGILTNLFIVRKDVNDGVWSCYHGKDTDSIDIDSADLPIIEYVYWAPYSKLEENGNITMNCRVSSLLPVNVVMYSVGVDGETILKEVNTTDSIISSTLPIHCDRQQVYCSVTNGHGPVVTDKATLPVIDCKVRIVPKLTNTTVEVLIGQRVELQAYHLGYPYPTATWYKLTDSGAIPITDDNKHLQSYIFQNTFTRCAVLRTFSAKVLDTGRYYVLLQQEVSMDIAVFKLTVKSSFITEEYSSTTPASSGIRNITLPPADPKITSYPVKVANGYTIKLTCNIGHVTESVKWVYNDVIYYSCSPPINGDVNCVVGSSVHNPDLYDFQFLPESGILTNLLIVQQDVNDGIWSCYHGKDADSVDIDSADLPIIEYVYWAPYSKLEENGNITMNCRVSSLLPVNVVMYSVGVDGETILKEVNTTDSIISSTLPIHCDRQQVYCSVTNGHGPVVTDKATLPVIDCKVRIVTKLTNTTVEVLEGQRVELQAYHLGYPYPTAAWYKLTDSGAIAITDKNKHLQSYIFQNTFTRCAVLRTFSAEVRDTGRYYVLLQQEVYTDIAVFKLTVKSPFITEEYSSTTSSGIRNTTLPPADPKITSYPVKVANGYTTKLTCNIGHVTESVKWVYNDVIYYSCTAPLNGGVNCAVGSSVHNPDLYDFQFLPESGILTNLFIVQQDVNDGVWSCYHGKDADSVDIDSADLPVIEYVYWSPYSNLEENGNITMNCRVSSLLPVNVVMYSVGVDGETILKEVNTTDSIISTTLPIHCDRQQVYCSVTNGHGPVVTDKTTLPLIRCKVRIVPKLTTTTVEVLEGQRVELKAYHLGYPYPTATWYKLTDSGAIAITDDNKHLQSYIFQNTFTRCAVLRTFSAEVLDTGRYYVLLQQEVYTETSVFNMTVVSEFTTDKYSSTASTPSAIRTTNLPPESYKTTSFTGRPTNRQYYTSISTSTNHLTQTQQLLTSSATISNLEPTSSVTYPTIEVTTTGTNGPHETGSSTFFETKTQRPTTHISEEPQMSETSLSGIPSESYKTTSFTGTNREDYTSISTSTNHLTQTQQLLTSSATTSNFEPTSSVTNPIIELTTKDKYGPHETGSSTFFETKTQRQTTHISEEPQMSETSRISIPSESYKTTSVPGTNDDTKLSTSTLHITPTKQPLTSWTTRVTRNIEPVTSVTNPTIEVTKKGTYKTHETGSSTFFETKTQRQTTANIPEEPHLSQTPQTDPPSESSKTTSFTGTNRQGYTSISSATTHNLEPASSVTNNPITGVTTIGTYRPQETEASTFFESKTQRQTTAHISREPQLPETTRTVPHSGLPHVISDPAKVANGLTTKLTCNVGQVTEPVKWVYNDVIYYSCSPPFNGGVNCVVGSSVHNPDLYDFQFLPESGILTNLFIVQQDVNDGIWSCYHGKDADSVDIDSAEQAGVVDITLANYRYRNNEGDNITVMCMTFSSKPIDVIVYTEGIRGRRTLKEIHNSSNSTVSVTTSTRCDEETFYCQASNGYGSASTKKLYVTTSCAVRKVDELTNTSVTATVGDDVILKAFYLGEPTPTVTWYRFTDKESVVLPSTNTFRQVYNNHELPYYCVLSITNVLEHYAGKYYVKLFQISKRVGQVSTSHTEVIVFHLTVTPKLNATTSRPYSTTTYNGSIISASDKPIVKSSSNGYTVPNSGFTVTTTNQAATKTSDTTMRSGSLATGQDNGEDVSKSAFETTIPNNQFKSETTKLSTGDLPQSTDSTSNIETIQTSPPQESTEQTNILTTLGMIGFAASAIQLVVLGGYALQRCICKKSSSRVTPTG